MPWDLDGNGNVNQNHFLGTTNNQVLAIRTNGAERMRLDTLGNVGVGTPTPGARLTVNVPGSSSPISALSVDVQSFGTLANAQASHYFRVRDIGAAPPNGVTHFMIRGDGNVGIGTTQPSARILTMHDNASDARVVAQA